MLIFLFIFVGNRRVFSVEIGLKVLTFRRTEKVCIVHIYNKQYIYRMVYGMTYIPVKVHLPRKVKKSISGPT